MRDCTVTGGVISRDVEQALILKINAIMVAIPENRHGKKERSRVKRYGWDYTKQKKMLEPIPLWLTNLIITLAIDPKVNSITINEYQPGYGISPHIDAKYFGPTIAILSLGGCARMILRPPPPRDQFECQAYDMPSRSLTVLTGEGRYEWTHEIEPESVTETRYSIVFRERLL